MIVRLQKYAYLVPEEHKLDVGSRVCFSKEGLEILATHSLVEVELKDDIREFLNADQLNADRLEKKLEDIQKEIDRVAAFIKAVELGVKNESETFLRSIGYW